MIKRITLATVASLLLQMHLIVRAEESSVLAGASFAAQYAGPTLIDLQFVSNPATNKGSSDSLPHLQCIHHVPPQPRLQCGANLGKSPRLRGNNRKQSLLKTQGPEGPNTLNCIRLPTAEKNTMKQRGMKVLIL